MRNRKSCDVQWRNLSGRKIFQSSPELPENFQDGRDHGIMDPLAETEERIEREFCFLFMQYRSVFVCL